MVPTKNRAGTTLADTSVITTTITTLVIWSTTLSASCTTRSVSPPWATTSAGVWPLTRRGPVCPCTSRRLIRSICVTHHCGNQTAVRYGMGIVTSRAATIPAAGQKGSAPLTSRAQSQGSTDPSRPSTESTLKSPTAASP